MFERFIYLLLTFCLLACSSFDTSETKWVTTDDNTLLWLSNVNTLAQYEWSGKIFDSVAHGEGKLTLNNPDGTSSSQIVNAFYGATDESEIVLLDDGSKYVGNLVDNMMEGFGVLVKGNDLYLGNFTKSKPNGYLKLYKNNKLFYDGNWTNGSFNGEGTLYKEDGTIKTGTWENGRLSQTFVEVDVAGGHYKGYAKDGKPDGIGKMEYANGSSYQGKWVDGKWHGDGLFVSSLDSIYGTWKDGKVCGDVLYRRGDLFFEGTFDNNTPLGIGALTTKDGTFYSGYWCDGKRNGMGDMIFPNGDTYSGEWHNNSFDGYGEYHYSSTKSFYRGEWKEGLQDGNGLYQSSDFSYDGEWEKGWMDGNGILYFKNKDKYEGTIHENLIDGIGCYTFANGNRYEGEFVKGKINGLGVFQFKSGNRFEGEFVNGKIYGDGTMYLIEKNGVVSITGFWPIDGSFPKEASILFPNGDLYEGPLKNGIPTEHGTWTSGKERQAKIDKIENSTAHKLNEFYKKHRETINWTLIAASAVVTTVEVACAGTVIGVPVAGALHNVNVAINVADASMAIASAGIDVYENDQLGEDNTEAMKNLGTEVGMNVALIFLPKVAKCAAKPLGKTVKNVARSSYAQYIVKTTGKLAVKQSALKFIKGKVFGKAVKINISVQSGIRKVERALIRNKVTQSTMIATGRLLTRMKHQTVRYSSYLNKIKSNPAIKEQLKLSAEGSSKNLGDNMRLLGTDKFVNMNERIRRYLKMPKRQVEPHHVIPSNPTTQLGKDARNIWTKYFESVDHPCNGIWLGRYNKELGYKALAKGSNHVSNSYQYEEYVSKALIQTYKKYQKQYAKNPDMMRKVLAETVDNLKEKLYKGELKIGSGAHKVHTPWSIFTDSRGIVSDAAKNITDIVNNVLINQR